MVHVLVEDLKREALECRRDCGDLRDDVDAVAVILDHPLDPAHLALDAVEPLDVSLLISDVAVGRGFRLAHGCAPSRMLRNRRRRRLLLTTKRLEAAIAAAATIGLSRPATASGIAATL